jgi:hypothetical protein
MNSIGDIISLKQFSFLNKEGLTARSNWRYNEVFPATAKFTVLSVDDEQGIGSHGECSPDLSNDKLMDYLHHLAKQEDDGTFICYWHESDIIDNY